MTERRRFSLTGRDLVTGARWLLRAQPAGYLLTISVASASLPVVGKHLEPFGAMTAMSGWAMRHLPSVAVAAARSCLATADVATCSRQREQAPALVAAALRGLVAPADLAADQPEPDQVPPVVRALEHLRYRYRSAVRYGSDPAQTLDVWRRQDLPAGPAPVLIFVPGGAWVHGSTALQGYALLSHLAERGWVCLSVNYRVAPRHRWPKHIIDVKTAIAWAHANVDKFGGDRGFVAVAGCSAGGHLAALAGLTGDDREFGAELPTGADTSVDAVVGIYGRYDWQDRSTSEGRRFIDYLERVVVRKPIRRNPDLYRKASPIARVHRQAPPFLVIHGSGDTVVPVQQSATFATTLRSVSQSPVAYLELPGAGHGFDLLDGAHAATMSTAVRLFLNQIHRDRAGAGVQQVV